MTALADHNNTVSGALVEARNAIAARAELYDAKTTGLRAKFQHAKDAVASQFGRRSPEFKTVSGIKY
jgi:hypothetical protein